MMDHRGMVVLVGAGCGPDLVTVRGLREIRTAEVLVYDDLIDRELLAEADPGCEQIYVGKRSGAHSMPQDKINRLLIEKASEGKRVVRLKGGDSFVFGRGGEECLALKEAGIPYLLVPGVTSAVAVPEAFGIPVTHRGMAQSFTVVTGHSGTGEEEDYGALAALKGTLVFLMGIKNLAEITRRLIACGKDPETPAAVLTEGFLPSGKRIDGTLGTITEIAADAPTPGILVVGETAAMKLGLPLTDETAATKPGLPLTDETAATKPGLPLTDETAVMRLGLPLSGCRVTVAGTAGFAEKTAELLRQKGADAEAAVCMDVELLKENIPHAFDGYGTLVFTSANGISCFFRTMEEEGVDPECFRGHSFACIGSATAKKLSEYGYSADLVPEEYTSEALGKALAGQSEAGGPGNSGPEQEKKKILILRAEQASPALTRILSEAGIPFEDRKIYRLVPRVPADSFSADAFSSEADGRTPDYLVFGSAGTVRAFLKFREIPGGTCPVCIGRFTAGELEKHRSGLFLTAEEYTGEGIAACIGRDWDLESRKGRTGRKGGTDRKGRTSIGGADHEQRS